MELDTKTLALELDVADKERDSKLSRVKMILRRYTGRAWDDSFSSDEEQPENHSYEFISAVLPRLVFKRPSVKVDARRVVAHRTVAEAMTVGVNAWVNQQDLEMALQQWTLDAALCWGVLMLRLEENERYGDGAVIPRLHRIHFSDWGCDPLASHWTKGRYQYHKWTVDLDELLGMDGLNPEAVVKLKEYTGDSGDSKVDAIRRRDDDLPHRKRVCLRSVWFADTNTIRTVAEVSGDPIEVFEPVEWWGPKTGPYHVLGFYDVPNNPYPLSPLVAVEDQTIALNVHAKAAALSANAYKRIALYNQANDALGSAITTTAHGHAMGVPNFDPTQMKEIELGGAQPSQYEYLNLVKQRLERASGMSTALAGVVTGDGTATENQIAASSLDARQQFMRRRVEMATSRLLGDRGVSWFLFNTPGVVIPVTTTDPTTGMDDDGLFLGGKDPADNGAEVDDFDISVTPYSMEAADDATRRRDVMELLPILFQIVQSMPMTPFVKWDELLEDLGKRFNMPDIGRLINREMLGMMPYMTPPLPSSVGGGQGINGMGGGANIPGGMAPMQRTAPRPIGYVGPERHGLVGGPMGSALRSGEAMRQRNTGV